ncbi:hypothetical protein Tco_1383052, partial [Tanacetum coccineum]
DEQQQTGSGTNEGASDKPEVPDVPEYRSESEEESWTFSHGEDEEEDKEHDRDEFVHPTLSTYKANEEEKVKAEDDNEVTSDQKVSTPPDYELTEEDENQQDDDTMGGEQEDEEDEELYGDLNINLNQRDAEMMDAQINQETREVHVTLTTEPPVVQQQSSLVSSDLVSKFINPSLDIGIDSILNPNVAVSVTPSSNTTIPQPPIPIIQPQQQTHDSTTTTTIPTTTLPEIPNFTSLFGFDRRMKDEVNVALELKSNKLREEAQAENQDFLNLLDSNIKRIINEQVKAQTSKIMIKVKKYVTETLGAKVLVRSTNQPQTSYTVSSSLSELKLKKILMDKMEENNSIDRFDVQKNLYRALLKAYNSDKDLLSLYGEVVTLKRGRNDQDKYEEPSARSNRGSLPKSSGKSAQEEEHDPRVDDLEEPFHQEFYIGNDDVSPVRETIDVNERLWNPSGSRNPDREWNQTKTVDDRPPQ